MVRRLLQDGRVSYQGETVRIESFDLWFSPRHKRIPIYASAVARKMTALCGEIADGVILTRSTLATAAIINEQLAEGARLAGRDPGQIVVTTLLPAAIAESRREALDRAVRAVSNELIDATSVVGTPAECRERVEAYRRSGIDVPMLSPFARGPAPGAKAKFEVVIRACGPEADSC